MTGCTLPDAYLDMNKNIIFIRTSTTEQTPELQLADIQSLNPGKDVTIILEQQSAWRDAKRPQWEKVKTAVIDGKVDTIYVWNLDRIYRNRKKLVEFLRICAEHKTKVRSFCQKWLDSIQMMDAPFNEIMFDMMLQILGWIAEEESNTKSSRVKMAVRKTAKGTFSHLGNRWGRKAFPQQTISRVMELHNKGISVRGIAALVTVYDENRNEKKISKSAVHKIISEKAL